MTWKKKIRRRWERFKNRPATDSWRGKQLTRAKLIRNLAILFIGCIIFGTLMAMFLFAWYARSLPQPDKIVRREGFATKILDRNGELLYEVYADQRRTPIELSQVPESLKQATIAIEDKSFMPTAVLTLKGLRGRSIRF